jgi:hypothetical protein
MTAADAFREEYENRLKDHKTRKDAFFETDKSFREKHGFGVYTSIESFKSSKKRRSRSK